MCPFAANHFFIKNKWKDDKGYREYPRNINDVQKGIVLACNAIGIAVNSQWMHPPLRMLQPRNAVVVIPIFQ